MARFAVIGLGRFGSHLAARLYELGHEVLGVDNRADLVAGMASRVSQVVEADARDKQQLRAIGLKDFDTVVISVGEHLEASTLAALYCKELGVRVVARAFSEDHAKILEALGVDQVVNPEREGAVRLAEKLSHSNLLDYIPLGEDYTIVEVAAPESLRGRTLADLDIRKRFNVYVLAIQDVLSGNVAMLPPPTAVIHESDVLVVVGRSADVERLSKLK
jgi:trk system potassium uptake protein TrkA